VNSPHLESPVKCQRPLVRGTRSHSYPVSFITSLLSVGNLSYSPSIIHLPFPCRIHNACTLRGINLQPIQAQPAGIVPSSESVSSYYGPPRRSVRDGTCYNPYSGPRDNHRSCCRRNLERETAVRPVGPGNTHYQKPRNGGGAVGKRRSKELFEKSTGTSTGRACYRGVYKCVQAVLPLAGFLANEQK
jgi:hypothetical protein